MQNLLDQFKNLTPDEKLAFMKEAMPHMAAIFKDNPQEMMAEMMPFCMRIMKSTGMDMERMRGMMSNMMNSTGERIV